MGRLFLSVSGDAVRSVGRIAVLDALTTRFAPGQLLGIMRAQITGVLHAL